MLKWIKSLFKKTEKPIPKLDYTPDERLIFKYWNGTRWVLADPLVLYKRIMAVAPSLAIDMKVAASISKDAEVKEEEVDKTLRGIFQIQPLNGIEVTLADGTQTLTHTEVLILFDKFMSDTESVKKNGRMNPTPATETSPSGPSSTTSSMEQSPATNPSSGSG